MITLKKRTKKKLADRCTLWAMFFLPFGYDAIFKFFMDLTSYWVADTIFYSIFFILLAGRFYFLEQNPITVFVKWYKRTLRKVKKLKAKMPWLFNKRRWKKSAKSIDRVSDSKK